MQVSLDKPQLQRVKNILIRSPNKDHPNKKAQHPETTHILKYCPKYYKSLTIDVAPNSPLSSKIKKIKKLKKFKGLLGKSLKARFPQRLWLNLLANNRKEIEEAPELISEDFGMERNRPFWKRVSLQKIKHFPNVTRVSLKSWRFGDSDFFLTAKKLFIRYIWNLRRLKRLEIPVWEHHYEETKWVFKKVNRRKRLLERLETFSIDAETQGVNIRELFQNKNLFSHVTDLRLSVEFDPAFAEIPNICKNLKSLSLNFCEGVNGTPEFLGLLTSIQHLDQLKRLEFGWPAGARNFWSHFKPQSSLRELTLSLQVSDLINERLFGEDIEPKDPVGHWDYIQELDLLKVQISNRQAEEIVFAKQFMTKILRKVRKVRSLNYSINGPMMSDEPFSVEEVPHLYDTLERYDLKNSNFYGRPKLAKFDLKMMKPFKKLKELKLEGHQVTYENVEEAVALLEENQKEGETSVLEIKNSAMVDQDWFGETLQKIEKIKRGDKNMKILFDLKFSTANLVGVLERLCKDIQAVKTIKGLEINLLLAHASLSPLPVEKFKQIFKRYKQVRNVRICLRNGNSSCTYIKIDGEKEQFF